MIDPQELASTAWCTERDWQTKANAIKRTAKGVKNMLEGDLELSTQERAILESACELLNNGLSVYETTARIAANAAKQKR